VNRLLIGCKVLEYVSCIAYTLLYEIAKGMPVPGLLIDAVPYCIKGCLMPASVMEDAYIVLVYNSPGGVHVVLNVLVFPDKLDVNKIIL
jgi:hypothetical protein